MKAIFLISAMILLSHSHVHGFPTLKRSIDDATLMDTVIKTPLGLLRGDGDQVKNGINNDGDDSNKVGDDSDDQSGGNGDDVNIRLDSDDSFCLLLPPNPGEDVAGTETEGTPFCTSSSGNHRYPKLPSGFIQTSHFVSTPDYVQVTGKMNSDAYSLGSQDGGGQYDHRDVPDVKCNGYKYFVSLLEPDVNRYCIRCCNSEEDCPVGKSGYGCTSIVNGEYDE